MKSQTIEMREIHKRVFDILERRMRSEPRFFFTLRKTNRFGRLDKRYWFHGNENYLAVSFWSGMDWKNKTPNIFFVVEQSGRTYLEVSVSDSDNKRLFVEKYLIPRMRREGISLNLQRWPNHIFIEFLGNDFVRSLDAFLEPYEGIKKIIDDVIRECQPYFLGDSTYESIGFIQEAEFNTAYARVKEYQKKRSASEIRKSMESQVLLRSITVRGVGDIRENRPVKMKIPPGTNWVFITGENGSGKSTILKAITASLNKAAHENFFPHVSPNDIELSFDIKLGDIALDYERHSKHQYLTGGFAAYGASRLVTTEEQKASVEKISDFYSIFKPDGVLMDVDTFMEELRMNYPGNDIATNLLRYLEGAFNEEEDLFPQIARVDFKSVHDIPHSLYYEKDKEGNIYPEPVHFDQLSSGTRSLIALIGDMFCRLFYQMPYVSEPSELFGIVLIDEIDVHFHPEMQKRIVEILSASFPRVQFIVTTHSPIPLLGAPENSVFFRAERNFVKGVTVKKIDVDISDLLPNTILSSPIFGFEKLIPNTHDPNKKVRTESTYQQVKKRDQIRDFLKDIAKRMEE